MWTPLVELAARIEQAGGFVNAHAHLDRAYTARQEDFTGQNVNAHLFEKWELVNQYKSTATDEVYHQHITRALQGQREQGVQAVLSFIDCDPVCDDRALTAAIRAKESYPELRIACQTLRGVRDKDARRWFDHAVQHVDIIGGLPKKDSPFEGEHLDVLFETAKLWKKRVHVHVDQLNDPDEKETEFLARKVMEHGLEGQVTAIHSISLAAHPEKYRREVYKMCRDAGLSFIACPTAWIDARRNETLTPTHNAITPIDEMIPEGLVVAIGTDNICDVYKPFCDGDLMTELRVLLEATHFYDIDELVKVATTNGRLVLGLDD